MRVPLLARLLDVVDRRPGRALLLYWPIAFIGTHFPRFVTPRQPPPYRLPLDKIGHFVGYAVLAWLLMLVLLRFVRLPAAIILTILIIAAYGALDELTQPYVNRSADIWDYSANLVGCGLGIAVALGRPPPSLSGRR